MTLSRNEQIAECRAYAGARELATYLPPPPLGIDVLAPRIVVSPYVPTNPAGFDPNTLRQYRILILLPQVGPFAGIAGCGDRRILWG